MPSNYPGSLDSFATNRTTGQVVAASTDNDHSDAINRIEAELGTDPAGTASTVKERLDNRVPSGTGSPEGVVTASPGAIYQQTDGTQVSSGSTVAWIKETGTGNTGWRTLRTVIPVYIDLFATRGGTGFTLPTGVGTYSYLTATTASSRLLVDYLTGRVIEAIFEVIWTPNDADNGVRLVKADAGPTGEVELKAFTGLTTATPIASADFVDIGTIWHGNTSKYLLLQQKTDAAVAPVLYGARVTVMVEV